MFNGAGQLHQGDARPGVGGAPPRGAPPPPPPPPPTDPVRSVAVNTILFEGGLRLFDPAQRGRPTFLNLPANVFTPVPDTDAAPHHADRFPP